MRPVSVELRFVRRDLCGDEPGVCSLDLLAPGAVLRLCECGDRRRRARPRLFNLFRARPFLELFQVGLRLLELPASL